MKNIMIAQHPTASKKQFTSEILISQLEIGITLGYKDVDYDINACVEIKHIIIAYLVQINRLRV